jgi:toxin ParE1/3/4
MADRVSRTSEVRRDLVELADHIAQHNLDAALRFLDAADETFAFLAVNREAGQRYPTTREELAAMRVWPVHGFRNHLVFYRPIGEGVEIVRVLHGARDFEALFGA